MRKRKYSSQSDEVKLLLDRIELQKPDRRASIDVTKELKELLESVENDGSISKHEYSQIFYTRKRNYSSQSDEVKLLLDRIELQKPDRRASIDVNKELEELLESVENGGPISKHEYSHIYFSRKRHYTSQNDKVKLLLLYKKLSAIISINYF